MRQQVPGARLIVVGDGPRRPDYTRMAAREFRNDGYPDLLGPEEGVLVPTRNHVVFADAIVGLLRHPERRARMGGAGRDKALGYNWPTVAQRLVSYYRKILGRS